MPSLPTTVTIAELPFHLPSGLPVWGNDLQLDLVIQPDRLHMELRSHFDAMNAKLIARSKMYSDLNLPGPLSGKHALTLSLVASPALCAQYHALFKAAHDPIATFVAGPKPEGAKHSPLLQLQNWERRSFSTSEDDDDGLSGLLDDLDLDNI